MKDETLDACELCREELLLSYIKIVVQKLKGRCYLEDVLARKGPLLSRLWANGVVSADTVIFLHNVINQIMIISW
jgi:hypothetical protein